MENEKKRIARVLQPAAKNNTTETSQTGRLLQTLRNGFSALLLMMASGMQLLAGFRKQMQGRDYIPITPPIRANRS